MALMRLGAIYIDGTTNPVDTPVLMYEVPAGKRTLVSNMSVLNAGASAAAVKVWFIEAAGAVSPPAEKNRRAYGSLANDGWPVELKSDAMEAGGKIYVQSDIIGVNFVASGDQT